MMRTLFIPLVIFAVLSCSPLRIYQQDPDILAWEADIQKFEHLDSTENYPDNAILFAGSSSIRLWETLAQDMSPYPVIQRGYGGAKLSDLAIYARRILYPHECRAIVLFIANDIAGTEDDKNPGEVDRLFRTVLKIIRDKYPVTPVFWIAVTPTALRWEVWPQIEKANRLIEETCLKNANTYFIRTDFAFLNASSQPKGELFLPDRLHLNAKGYEVWTGIIKKELNKVLGEE